MKEFLGEEWFDVLKDEFDKQYMKDLKSFITQRRNSTTVYPNSDEVFNAYRYTPYSKVRICILGQDVYPNGEGHGIAFSSRDGKYTPSLRKIHEAVENECYNGLELNWDNNLTRWTEQGIFLLNTILTVDKGKSLSHQNKGWEQFTLKTIQELDKRGNIVFLLWGKNAQEYDRYITKGINNVIMCEHPVAASYGNRKWNSNECFIHTNRILNILGEKEIVW